MTLKILIADDELGIILSLETIISAINNVSVVGKASTIQDAYRQILQTEPDIIFLDIHFPDGSGIDLAERLFSSGMDINIIFITTDPSFSLDAFNVYSYDYIIKPVDENRLLRTITRLKKQIELKSPAHISEKKEEPCRIAVKKEKEIILIDQETIIFLEITGKKITMHCFDNKYELTGTLDQLEKKLAHNYFRSHKSYLVNIYCIQKIVPWNDNTYLIYFKNTTEQAALSRRKYQELLERMVR